MTTTPDQPADPDGTALGPSDVQDDDLDAIERITDPLNRTVMATDCLTRYETLVDRARLIRNQGVRDMLTANFRACDAAEAIGRSRAYVSANFPRAKTPDQPADGPRPTH